MTTIEGHIEFVTRYHEKRNFPSRLIVKFEGTIGSDGDPAEYRFGLTPEVVYRLKELIQEWE